MAINSSANAKVDLFIKYWDLSTKYLFDHNKLKSKTVDEQTKRMGLMLYNIYV